MSIPINGKVNAENNTPKEPEMAAPADIKNQPSSYMLVPRREDSLKKRQLVLRSIGLLSSIISFAVIASKNQTIATFGFKYDINLEFQFDAYRYLFGVGIVSSAYTMFQVWRQFIEMYTGKYLLSQRGLNFLDFIGDQIIAYLLMSAASAAIPTTEEWKKWGVPQEYFFYGEISFTPKAFRDSSAASISMAFMAFLATSLSALISGYKLSTQMYI